MSIFELIGIAWTVLGVAVFTVEVFYLSIKQIKITARLADRGEVEELLDARIGAETNYLTKRQR